MDLKKMISDAINNIAPQVSEQFAVFSQPVIDFGISTGEIQVIDGLMFYQGRKVIVQGEIPRDEEDPRAGYVDENNYWVAP